MIEVRYQRLGRFRPAPTDRFGQPLEPPTPPEYEFLSAVDLDTGEPVRLDSLDLALLQQNAYENEQ